MLIAGAMAWDLRGSPTESHPFLVTAVGAGSPIPPEAVAWQPIPAGLLRPPDPAATVAAVDLQPGDPLTASVVTEAVAVPDGWWAVPMSLGRHADPGDEVMLVLIDPPITIGGVVLESESGDRYSLDFSPAVVAVPGESAALAAAASAEGRMIAVVRP